MDARGHHGQPAEITPRFRPRRAPVGDGPPAAGALYGRPAKMRRCAAQVRPIGLPHHVPMPALRVARSTVMRRVDASVTPSPP